MKYVYKMAEGFVSGMVSGTVWGIMMLVLFKWTDIAHKIVVAICK